MNRYARSVPFVLPLALALVGCGGAEPLPATPAPPSSAPAPAVSPPPPAASAALPPWAPKYPPTRTVDAKDILFGTEVRDPYRWLEDASSSEVQSWMKAQDELTRAKLSKLPERDAIAARLKDLFYVDSQSIPHTRGSRVFYSRRSGAQEKSVVYFREGKKGKEQVLLDPNGWSADGSKSLRGWSVSWDGKKVAYTATENNADEATMHVMDVATGKESSVDQFPGAKYATASWTPKGDGFYYVRLPVDPIVPDRSATGLRRRALPPPRKGPRERPDCSRPDRGRIEVRRRLDLARRPLPLLLRPERVELERPLDARDVEEDDRVDADLRRQGLAQPPWPTTGASTSSRTKGRRSGASS